LRLPLRGYRPVGLVYQRCLDRFLLPSASPCCVYSIFSTEKIYKGNITHLRRYFPVLSLSSTEVKHMADLVRERLQRLRQQRGLTLQGLAALAQVSPSQIWNIESGMRQGRSALVSRGETLSRSAGRLAGLSRGHGCHA